MFFKVRQETQMEDFVASRPKPSLAFKKIGWESPYPGWELSKDSISRTTSQPANLTRVRAGKPRAVLRAFAPLSRAFAATRLWSFRCGFAQKPLQPNLAPTPAPSKSQVSKENREKTRALHPRLSAACPRREKSSTSQRARLRFFACALPQVSGHLPRFLAIFLGNMALRRSVKLGGHAWPWGPRRKIPRGGWVYSVGRRLSAGSRFSREIMTEFT